MPLLPKYRDKLFSINGLFLEGGFAKRVFIPCGCILGTLIPRALVSMGFHPRAIYPRMKPSGMNRLKMKPLRDHQCLVESIPLDIPLRSIPLAPN